MNLRPVTTVTIPLWGITGTLLQELEVAALIDALPGSSPTYRAEGAFTGGCFPVRSNPDVKGSRTGTGLRFLGACRGHSLFRHAAGGAGKQINFIRINWDWTTSTCRLGADWQRPPVQILAAATHAGH